MKPKFLITLDASGSRPWRLEQIRGPWLMADALHYAILREAVRYAEQIALGHGADITLELFEARQVRSASGKSVTWPSSDGKRGMAAT